MSVFLVFSHISIPLAARFNAARGNAARFNADWCAAYRRHIAFRGFILPLADRGRGLCLFARRLFGTALPGSARSLSCHDADLLLLLILIARGDILLIECLIDLL
jgi:hypothetical protein